MKSPYSIIKHPLITEKGAQIGPQDKYLFSVDIKANKSEIKKAIEDIYKVKVVKVNTMRVSGKKRRVRYKEGRTSNWKKAIVTLVEGEKIEFV